jgi:hypothetical protein
MVEEVDNVVLEQAATEVTEAETAPETSTATESVETIEIEAPKEGADEVFEEPKLLTPDDEKSDVESESKEGSETEDTQEETQSDDPAPLPVYEEFVLPEDFQIDKGSFEEFTKSLAEFEVSSKAPHEEVQKFGQQLINKYTKELQTAIEKQGETYINAYLEKKKAWVDELKNDPDIGGKRFDTTISEVKQFVRTYGGNKEQQDAFYKALAETGMDAHPEMIRFIMNVKNGSNFKSPQPLTPPKPIEAPKTRIQKYYGSSQQ